MATFTQADFDRLQANMEFVDLVANGAVDEGGTGIVESPGGQLVRTAAKVIDDIASTESTVLGYRNDALAAQVAAEAAAETAEELALVNWWKWGSAGSATGVSSTGAPALCSISKTDFVYLCANSDVIQRYTYDHSAQTVTKVGSDSSTLTGLSYCGVSALSATRIAIIGEGYGLAAFDWNAGTSKYKQVGNILTISGMFNPSIVALSSNRVAVWHTIAGNTYLKTFDFDGTDWAQVGNSYAFGSSVVYTCITAFSPTTVVINVGSQGRNLRKMSFDGTDWTPVGSDSSNIGTNCGEADICALNDTDVLHIDSWNEDFSIWRNYNNTWSKIITLASEAIPSGHVPALCSILDNVVVYKESHETTIRVYKIEKIYAQQPFKPF